MKPTTYEIRIPITPDQGPTRLEIHSPYLGSIRGEALRQYNSMRAHDGQPPLTRLPVGTKITKRH